MSGYRLVPVEPTEDMVAAGCEQHECEQGDPWYNAPDLSEHDCRAIYAAMLASAPQPAEAVQGEAQAWQYRSCVSVGLPPGEWSEWQTVVGPLEATARHKAEHRPDLYEVRPLFATPAPSSGAVAQGRHPVVTTDGPGCGLRLDGVAQGRDAEDAARYRWLRERLMGANFEYEVGDEETVCVLVFEIPDEMRVSANLDATIDAVRTGGA